MSDTVQFVMPGCIMAIPKGRRVTVYEVVNSGFISDSRYTVVLDHCAQIYYGISPEIFNWLAQGMPGHPTFKLSKQTKGVVMWSHVIRNIGAPDISEVRVALNTAMAGLVPSITEGASPRIKLKTAHPEIFLSEAGIEQQWPSGALHSIIFEHPSRWCFTAPPRLATNAQASTSTCAFSNAALASFTPSRSRSASRPHPASNASRSWSSISLALALMTPSTC